ncbi:hypothetical protein DPMN_180119 [Dreissena polymorpha]|uniref:Uncharacterized protein n=1 Tax=Dreissena polymorpha TaxID=45954 RepID=A0A9D4EGB7_DREPO|nr:hypothetical protein DPMN_180119 [Dreissena polymorpha]
MCSAGSSSLPAFFCGYLRDRHVFCRIIKPACLLLWIPQGKTCVLQDHQACLPSSVDTSGTGMCSAGSSSLPAYFCRYLRDRHVFCRITKSACLLLWILQGKACVLQDHQACLPTSVDTSGTGMCSAGSSSLPAYFCGYLREKLVFCRIIKPACLLLWIPQGKACVLQDHQACLTTSVDTSGKDLHSAGSPSLPVYFCGYLRERLVFYSYQACLSTSVDTSGKRISSAGSSSLPAYFCGYLRERLVLCRIIKPACLLLWIPQGKACVLQDNQVCLSTSMDTSGKGLCYAGSPSLLCYFCGYFRERLVLCRITKSACFCEYLRERLVFYRID